MRVTKRSQLLAGLLVSIAVCALVFGIAGCGGQHDSSTTATRAAAMTSATSGPSTSVPSSDVSSSATSKAPMTAERARKLHANEMGQILVLMYHLIESPSSRYARTPDEFRNDIAQLKENGYYPINVSDLASGKINVPAGKSPVVITFDDSSPGQYRILGDGSVDPDCAVGILLAAAKSGGWARKATFFPLIDVTPNDHDIFGQPELKQKKLQNLVRWGFEIGSHTVTHANLQKTSPEQAAKELFDSKTTLEDLIGGDYKVTSLAIPLDAYPAGDSLLPRGEYQGKPYEYTTILKATGGPSVSPFSSKFDVLRIHRIEIGGKQLEVQLKYMDAHPDLRYVSDGDPTTLSAPQKLADELGELKPSLSGSSAIIRY